MHALLIESGPFELKLIAGEKQYLPGGDHQVGVREVGHLHEVGRDGGFRRFHFEVVAFDFHRPDPLVYLGDSHPVTAGQVIPEPREGRTLAAALKCYASAGLYSVLGAIELDPVRKDLYITVAHVRAWKALCRVRAHPPGHIDNVLRRAVDDLAI